MYVCERELGQPIEMIVRDVYLSTDGRMKQKSHAVAEGGRVHVVARVDKDRQSRKGLNEKV